MTAERWPIAYLRPARIMRHIAPRTTAGTVSTAGFTQRISVPIHSWQITYENILVGTAEQLRVWDAYEAYLDGGSTPILVPLIGDATTSTPDGTSVGAYTVGATVMTVQRVGAPIVAGQHFSIQERLYRAFGVTDLGGDQYQFSFRPPLRDGFPTGWPIWFNDLICRCRLATDDEMSLTIDPAKQGVATVHFVEDPNTD